MRNEKRRRRLISLGHFEPSAFTEEPVLLCRIAQINGQRVKFGIRAQLYWILPQ